MQLNSRNDAAYWPKVPGLSGVYPPHFHEKCNFANSHFTSPQSINARKNDKCQ